MPDPLCSDCLSFQDSLKTYSYKSSSQILKPNITSLEQSAKQGCELCRVTYQSLIYAKGVSFQDTEASIKITTKDSVFYPESPEDRFEILSIDIQQLGYTDSTYLTVLFNDGAQEQAFKTYSELIGRIQDTDTDEGIESLIHMTSKWIQNCQSTHSQCGHQNIPNSINRVPTRLIDVGTNDDNQPPRLFIPSQDQASENLEYVALSYAWGPVDHHLIKTTASNLQQMLIALPFSRLPQTIHDAIIFTRKLGFKYLWVDALCILQSEGPHDTIHQQDWSREATRFGYYYQNAVVTIAATGATSSACGLFLPRPALAFDPKPVILRREMTPGKTRDISILPILPTWTTEIRGVPLYERGWAIQERILSARVVHFATNMVLWECQECRATEIDPVGSRLKDAHNGMVHEEVSDFMPIFRNLQRNGEGASQVIREWYSFIEGYTAAKFTFMRDRLPALSGVAALIQKYIPQRYGAGLWESAVPEGLAWLVEDDIIEGTPGLTNTSGTRKDLQLMLPSWSWATSRGPVRFVSSLDTWELLLKMEDWEVESTGVDTSGQIVKARLRVTSAFRVLSALDLGLSPYSDRAAGFESTKMQASFTRAAFMDSGSNWHDAYACILLGTAYLPRYVRTDGVIGCALILEPTGRSRGSIEEYKRVGFSCLPFRDWWIRDIQEKTIELV
ncbi:hypothetical protein FPOA_06689 [Fusarium poae]|uniref:Heterokaryon incompatibility domain-containing protein n=1 Tax=Fusarium poae TaxID=36050 RepID=A0A1B8AIY3_FUSPO|nr:hypothetical protein FPOA_06689 [Fusarium poae]